MKQAVKFDNFNLSIDQMGTFLAFAQQQAKDTGQDVNYLVDSIVTGLGRKSLPILDNLGLSAEEIRDRMKETGDMTTAVAQIIKERMEAAGGYVETAADRAAQAQVRLDNAMTDLGRTMDSLTEDGASLWTELKIGAINLANTAIKPLIKMFSSLASYIRGTSAEEILTNSLTDVTDTVDDNGRLIRKDAISSIPNITVSGTAPKKKGRSGGGGKTFNPASIAFNANKAALAAVKPEDITGPSQAWEAYTSSLASAFEEPLSPLQQLNKELAEMKANLENAPDTQSYQQGLSLIAEKEKEIAKFKGETKTEDIAKDTEDAWKGAANAMASVGSAMASIEDPTAKTVGIVMQAIATVAQAFSQALSEDKTTTGNIWAFIAAALASTASMVSVISSIHSATGYAQGGIVTGNSYSGDNIPIMANAQEVVLTRAMAGNLASQLEGNGLGNLNLTATVSAEQIRFTLNNNGRRTGRGEFVQTNSR
jgi:exonuclease VII small subunit